MIRGFWRYFLIGILLCEPACTKRAHQPEPRRDVVVAVEGDVDSFNPLFAEEAAAGEINDLIFPALVGSRFDTSLGALDYYPLLARSWNEAAGGRDLVFHLRTDARWQDGPPVEARDVQFSYQLYGDPAVGSVRQSAVESLRRYQGKADVARSVEVVDDSTVVFHFERNSGGQLFDAGLPILPAHILKSIPRGELRTCEFNRRPVGSGPFLLQTWTRLQEIVLASNPSSQLPFPARLPRLVFRVIPEEQSRVAQLRSGEVDVVSDLRVEDARLLQADSDMIRIISIPGRNYDFLGWNNIDPTRYAESHGSVIVPHPLFGSAKVRRALTMAIDRKEIVRAFLGVDGQVAFGGVSPLFRWAFNDSLAPLPFDPSLSRRLLAEEGWRPGKGILEKGGRTFSFALVVPSGNRLRASVAAVVQQQLKAVGMDMKIVQVEPTTFWQEVTARKYDAWLAGFSVPLRMQLDDLWGSELSSHPFNLTGFRNARVDRILREAAALRRETDGGGLWKEFQVIVQQEQPCTFLFWTNTLVGVNRRVRGTHVGVFGTTAEAWDWRLADSSLTDR